MKNVCIQQHKTIQYETVDGKSGSLQVSNTSTEDLDKQLLNQHLQKTHGFQENDIQVEYDKQTQSYIVLYDSVYNKFVRSCSICEATTEEDKQKVKKELKAFVKEHQIKELDLTDIYAHYSFTTIGIGAFQDCKSLTNIILSDTMITNIGYDAFSCCSSLASISLPDSMITIQNSAFWKCHALKSIVIPKNVKTIGNYAFAGCKSLRNITLQNSITSIGEYSFSGCESLRSIILPNSITTIGQGAFLGCLSL